MTITLNPNSGVAAQTPLAARTRAGEQVQDVAPAYVTGGILSVQTAATGSNWTAFASQACTYVVVVNGTNFGIEVRRGGAGVGLPIQPGQAFTFEGVQNASDLSVRRLDQSNTQLTLHAHWVD